MKKSGTNLLYRKRRLVLITDMNANWILFSDSCRLNYRWQTAPLNHFARRIMMVCRTPNLQQRLYTLANVFLLVLVTSCHCFVPRCFIFRTCQASEPALHNVYDDWRSDAIVDTLPLDEDNVLNCLQEFVQSDYGKQMFGCHPISASYGITGALDFVEVDGPEVILTLSGAFWHKRSTVLGRAAVWLNARMPEIAHVNVADQAELEDFENIVDELSGEVLYVKDKRAEDFNGDRGTMEYQGMDPDVRGPFPQGPLTPGGSLLSPS